MFANLKLELSMAENLPLSNCDAEIFDDDLVRFSISLSYNCVCVYAYLFKSGSFNRLVVEATLLRGHSQHRGYSAVVIAPYDADFERRRSSLEA